jgi:hypothetical protein
MTQTQAADELTPAVPAERMLANMRSATKRGLPPVTLCRAHGLTLSVAGGGPSLADTYQDLDGWVCAVNGSLRWLLQAGVNPSLSYACGIMDAGEHIADMIEPDPKVRYYVASICDPSVFDKLKGFDVRLWHVSPDSTEAPDGVEEILNEAYPSGWFTIGGGCTMGLRWIDLGYVLGFRRFKLHGMDSSFRSGRSHAYPDRADAKDHFEYAGRLTRPNFLAQVRDLFRTINRFSEPDRDPIELLVFGDGLLQDEYARWRESHEPTPMVCCVKMGDKYGPEYVTRLRDGVARHLAAPHNFVCFTDDPVPGVKCYPLPAELPGWWAKLGLFRLKRPLIYFDLDVVITGDLSPLLKWQSFSAIKDWWLKGINSSVMVLTGNEAHVWDRFKPDVMDRCYGGDQQWIGEQFPPNLKTFPPHWFPSLKANSCWESAPEGAMAVIFHGNPKPAECGGWVADAWRGHETITANGNPTAFGRPDYPAAGPAA